jgi:hypothetical protein
MRVLRQCERVNSPRLLESLFFDPLLPLACLSRPSSDQIRPPQSTPETIAIEPAKPTASEITLGPARG